MSRAPTLNRRLALERRADLPDGAGGFTETWLASGYHWADVTAQGGNGGSGEFGPTGRLRLRITLRALPQGHEGRPDVGDRLLEGFRRYKIDAVHEAADHPDYLLCFCHEETGR